MTASQGTLGLPVQRSTAAPAADAQAGVEAWRASRFEDPVLLRRSRLLQELQEADSRRVVTVSAPTGYGKTTLLWQWACEDPRSFVWLDVPVDADDPVALLAYVAQALHLLDGHMLAGPLDSEPFREAVALPRLGAEIRAISKAFVLVLDDVHHLISPAAWRVVATLVGNIPPGSHIVLSGQAQPSIPLGGLNAHRDLFQLATADLAMDAAETAALLERVHPELSSEARAAFAARSRGWAAVLNLAGRPGVLPDAMDGRFGDEETLELFVREEVLDPLPLEVRRFLARTSVHAPLSAASCDAVLQQQESRQMLDRIEHDHVLLGRLDGQQQRFSLHPLVRAALRQELTETEPELLPVLHLRAAAWYEQQLDLDEAVRQSIAVGDPRRTAELIWISMPSRLTAGRRRTVEEWLALFSVEQVLADPLLALSAAWCALAGGRNVELWLGAAERAPQQDDRNLPADTTPIAASIALLRATLAPAGATQMDAGARQAVEMLSSSDPGRAFAIYLTGVAAGLDGDSTTARAALLEGQNVAALLTLPAIEAACCAQLALLACDDGNWPAAARWAAQATEIAEASHFEDAATLLPVHTAAALSLAHGHRFRDASRSADLAKVPLANDAPIPTWLSIQSRLVLARTHLLLGEPAPALLLLAAAEKAAVGHHAPGLRHRLDALREMAHATTVSTSLGHSTITGAELKVLQLLPTHLSFQEIGARLHLSRNTVKTQAISVYRKLGVSSRSDAVAQAAILGLDPEPSPDDPPSSGGPAARPS